MLKAAFLGLDFTMRECYAIPYASTLQFQTDYKGEVKLAKKYSVNPIKDIYAKLVRVGDDFVEEIRDGQQYISFKPQPFNDGEIIDICSLLTRRFTIYETIVKEIDHIRDNYSKIPKSHGQRVMGMCRKLF